MKIKMKTTSAGPLGVMLADKTYDVSDAMAKVFVSSNHASYETGMIVQEDKVVVPDVVPDVVPTVCIKSPWVK